MQTESTVTPHNKEYGFNSPKNVPWNSLSAPKGIPQIRFPMTTPNKKALGYWQQRNATSQVCRHQAIGCLERKFYGHRPEKKISEKINRKAAK